MDTKRPSISDFNFEDNNYPQLKPLQCKHVPSLSYVCGKKVCIPRMNLQPSYHVIWPSSFEDDNFH